MKKCIRRMVFLAIILMLSICGETKDAELSTDIYYQREADASNAGSSLLELLHGNDLQSKPK